MEYYFEESPERIAVVEATRKKLINILTNSDLSKEEDVTLVGSLFIGSIMILMELDFEDVDLDTFDTLLRDLIELSIQRFTQE